MTDGPLISRPRTVRTRDRARSALDGHGVDRGALLRRFLDCAGVSAPIVVLGLVAACAPVPVDPEAVQAECAERARQAQGPTGNLRVGVNSEDGPFTRVEIGITSDALAGRDPQEVYETCVIEGTGAPPTRPLVLG